MCVDVVINPRMFFVFMIGLSAGGIGVMLAYWKRIFKK